jgi:hypothetical protein
MRIYIIHNPDKPVLLSIQFAHTSSTKDRALYMKKATTAPIPAKRPAAFIALAAPVYAGAEG